MFVPTGWHDWELVMAALLHAWAVLGITTVLAFAIAYGLFREPRSARRGVLPAATGAQTGVTAPSSPVAVPRRESSPASAEKPVSESEYAALA